MLPALDVHGRPTGLENHAPCCPAGVAYDVSRTREMEHWDRRNNFKSGQTKVEAWQATRDMWLQAYGAEHPYVRHSQMVLEVFCSEAGVPVPALPAREPPAAEEPLEAKQGPSPRREFAVKVAQHLKGLGLCGPGDLKRDPSGRCYNVSFRMSGGVAGMVSVFSLDYLAVQWKRGTDSGRDVFGSAEDAQRYVKAKFVVGDEEAAASVPRRVPKQRGRKKADEGML